MRRGRAASAWFTAITASAISSSSRAHFAILDWELVHLAIRRRFGWICLQAWRGRSPYMCHLLTREELTRKYQALTGEAVDLARLHYWEVFGTFKLAVMHLGAAIVSRRATSTICAWPAWERSFHACSCSSKSAMEQAA